MIDCGCLVIDWCLLRDGNGSFNHDSMPSCLLLQQLAMQRLMASASQTAALAGFKGEGQCEQMVLDGDKVRALYGDHWGSHYGDSHGLTAGRHILYRVC